MRPRFVDSLLPQEHPGAWKPGTGIELLPALRRQYPGWVDDDLLSIQLTHRPDGDQFEPWQFSVLRPVAGSDHPEEFLHPVWPKAEDDNYRFERDDARRGGYPWRLLHETFELGRIRVLNDLLGLFRPTVRPLVDDIMQALDDAETRKVRNVEANLAAEATFHQERAEERHAFLVTWIVFLSTYIAANVDLAEDAVKRLKADSSTGIRDAADRSRWDEIVTEAASPSLLREGYAADVNDAVVSAFGAQPRAVQMAIWMRSADTQRGFERQNDWDVPDDSIDTFPLYDLDMDSLDAVASHVWFTADSEASENRARKDQRLSLES